jgi:hypothetical protein
MKQLNWESLRDVMVLTAMVAKKYTKGAKKAGLCEENAKGITS